MPVIPALKRQDKFKANLVHIVSSQPARAMYSDAVSNKTTASKYTQKSKGEERRKQSSDDFNTCIQQLSLMEDAADLKWAPPAPGLSSCSLVDGAVWGSQACLVGGSGEVVSEGDCGAQALVPTTLSTSSSAVA